MRITVTDNMRLASLEVDDAETIENIKALVEVEFGIPLERQKLFFNAQQLNNIDKLNRVGVTDHSMLLVTVSATTQPSSNTSNSTKGKLNFREMVQNISQNKAASQNNGETLRRQKFLNEAKRIKQQVTRDEHAYADIFEHNPAFAEAVMSPDLNVLANYLFEKDKEAEEKQLAYDRRFHELSKDPFNPEYQRLLEEHINKKNIQNNLEHAQEYTPEVFGQVCMLYINAKINKVPIQAFVDSGAQSTIMSKSCAERCNVMRLLDTNYAGLAVGVGTSKILGRVHAAEIEIEGKLLTCSLTVIENEGTDFLLGLDMLKRFMCVLDLKQNVLNFQDGLIITRFLSDGEINKRERKASKEITVKVDQNQVKNLENFGFGREEAIAALKQAGGNEELAANILSQKRFGH